MVYRFGVLLIVAIYVSSSTALPPCVCTRHLKPVCGSDGVTYSNECLLRCQKQNNVELTVVKEDACDAQPPCVCTLEYAPICGTNGVTYPNKCSMTCERSDIGIAYRGECRNKREGVEVNQFPPCVCTLEYAPICGTNGVTYPNKCSMTCERSDIGIAYRGECRNKREDVEVNQSPPCLCTREARYVCGTDGRTYSNPCMLNCARQTKQDLQLDHYGKCGKARVAKEAQGCSCTREMSLVCASNGVTYNNECLMKCAGEDLQVQQYGPC